MRNFVKVIDNEILICFLHDASEIVHFFVRLPFGLLGQRRTASCTGLHVVICSVLDCGKLGPVFAIPTVRVYHTYGRQRRPSLTVRDKQTFRFMSPDSLILSMTIKPSDSSTASGR